MAAVALGVDDPSGAACAVTLAGLENTDDSSSAEGATLVNPDAKLTLNPADVIQLLLTVNRPQAKVILAGMGVIAASAIVAAWRIDLTTARIVATYILGFAAALYVLTFILTDPSLKRVLGWFTILTVMAAVTALLVSSIAPQLGARIGLAPSYCMVQFWTNCEETIKEIVERNPPAEVALPKPPEQSVRPSDYSVSVRFAGIISRDAVIAVAERLKQDGWRVIEPRSGGGDRTEDAYGRNEVVYTMAADQAAALAVARRFQEARIVAEAISVRQDMSVPGNSLQVWLSRVSRSQ